MEKELREFGLSNHEISLYLALLKTGEETVNRLAEMTGIKRSTVYDNLSFLITKGIVSRFSKNNVQYFQAANPEKLVSLLDEKREST